MRKKILSYLLCLVLTFSLLTGCNGAADDKNSQPETQTSQTDELQEDSANPDESESGDSESEGGSESEIPPTSESEGGSESETPPTSESESGSDSEAEQGSEQKPNPKPKPTPTPDPEPQPKPDPTPDPEPGNGGSNNGGSEDLKPEELPKPDVPNTDGLAEVGAIIAKIIKPSMTDFEKVITIHDWLTFNIDYDTSYKNYHMAETLRDRKGVCQGYTELFQEMCKQVGIEANFIGGEGINSSGQRESHAWNQVKLDGKWYNVDVTWDDPLTGNGHKDPNDHSANGYDYFLVSDANFSDHVADAEYKAERKTCSADYNRATILKYAADSGLHGDAAFASNVRELDAAITKYMKADRSSFTLWYYDTSVVSNADVENRINSLLAQCSYPANLTRYYSPDNGVSKMIIVITPVSEWNKIPVVTNATEFQAVYKEMKAAGKKEFLVRYEVEGEKSFGAGSWRFYERKYNNGKYSLYTMLL